MLPIPPATRPNHPAPKQSQGPETGFNHGQKWEQWILTEERRGSPINPALRLQFIEALIRSWNFGRLLKWIDHHPERLTTREELLLCYARERKGELESWTASLGRIRQRILSNDSEHLAFRALSLQSQKDLRRVSLELIRWQAPAEDLLLQVAWVRVADRLAEMRQWPEALQLYSYFSATNPPSEWQSLTALKSIVLSYLSGTLGSDTTVALLRTYLVSFQETPLAQVYAMAFYLYIASVSARWLDQARLQNQLRKALLNSSISQDQAELLSIANYLLNPELGLGAALWQSQSPNSSSLIKLRYESNPEMIWLGHCMTGLENIQKASDQHSIIALQKALLEQEAQGNQLLAACARCRLLGLMLHKHTNDHEQAFVKTWYHELQLLQTMPYAEMQSFGALLQAAFHYRSSEFQECIQSLRRARQLSQDQFRRRIIGLWLAFAKGRMPRKIDPELNRVSHELSNYFFRPTLRSLGNGLYRVSDIFQVDLSLYPVLNRLLQQILRHPDKALAIHDVQRLVWRQTSSLEGWNQKLRNTVARLRFQFRFMLTPLVIQTQGMILLNIDAIYFEQPPRNISNERNHEILRALQNGPKSIANLHQITKIPSSTLRRYLHELKVMDQVTLDPKIFPKVYCLVSSAKETLTDVSDEAAKD